MRIVNSFLRMASSSLLLVILLTVSEIQSVKMPISAGEPLSKLEPHAFGSFDKGFMTCGVSYVKINPGFGEETTDLSLACSPDSLSILAASKPLFSNNVSLYDYPGDKECSIYFYCATNDMPETHSVCARGVSKSLKESVSILFTNEFNCDKIVALKEYAKKEDTFLRNRWLPENATLLNYRPSLTPNHAERQDMLPLTFAPEKKVGKKVYKRCDTTCDKGTTVKVTMKNGKTRLMVYLSETCPSFKICLNAKNFLNDKKVPECLEQGMWEFLVKNGVVRWPNREFTTVFRMKDPRLSVTAIEVGYGVERNGKVYGELYVGNAFQEYITSDTKGYDQKMARYLTFFFPSEDCLLQKVGIVSKNILSATTLVSASAVVTAGKSDGEDGSKIDQKTGESLTTTTPRPPPPMPKTTTKAPPVANLMEGVILTDESDADSIYMAGKWWTWGIFIGFVLGTVITDIVGGALFYLFRRTVYAHWYRGMFKRYQCDASGTTGGVTGAGFGNTTTGAMTMGGTTGGTSTMTSSNTSTTNTSNTTNTTNTLAL